VRRHPNNPDDPNHTFYFTIGDGKRVIDAAVGGNAARWINHSCKPNCEADEDEDAQRVFIKALRNIKAGEELNYDYGPDRRPEVHQELKAEYLCLCGAKKCRGTMLAPRTSRPRRGRRRNDLAR
jgi:SET domain-containing protein